MERQQMVETARWGQNETEVSAGGREPQQRGSDTDNANSVVLWARGGALGR